MICYLPNVEVQTYKDAGKGYSLTPEKIEDFLEMLKVFVQTGCAAAVYTQTTDVEGEVNGLITYDRKVIKVDMPRIAKGNQSVIESMPSNK